MNRTDAADVKAAAAGRWPDVIATLAPELQQAIDAGPRRHTPCPVHGGKDGLRVFNDFEQTGGVVCNSCGEFADGLSTLQWVTGRDFADVLADVADALGMNGPATSKSRPPDAAPAPAEKTDAEDAAKRRERLIHTWQGATTDDGRIAAYLRFRGLSGDVPSGLRLHPALLCYSDDDPPAKLGTYPAMVAQVVMLEGEVVNLHRTYLSPDGPGKADVPKQKKLMPATREGATNGAAIRLAPAGPVLALTEGIETGLAVMEATGTPTWSCVAAGFLEKVELPPAVRKVQIWGDNDASGRGREAAEKLAARLRAEGREVSIFLPPEAGRDWLDVLISEGGMALLLQTIAPSNDRETDTADTTNTDTANEDTAAHYTPQNNRATVQPQPPSPPKLACERRILDRFADALRLQGVVGECTTAQTVYLSLTSRLLKKPVSLGVKGNSSSGKSHIVGKVVEFFPEAAVVLMTGVSERALVYEKEEYSHRSIIMYEAEGLREGNDENHTAYFFRSLLSEGRLDYRVAVRSKEGGFVTKRITKEGPTNMIFTTTRTRVHYENETRVLSLTTDDSADQTARVLQQLADESEDGPDLEEWKALQAWLQKANNRVTIPFALRLAELVPPAAVRLRRDFASVLELIRAHAVLHQQTREADEAGRIVATLDDYEVVRDLISDVISIGVGATISAVVRETVAAVEELASDKGVTARTIGEYLGLDKSAASRRLRTAADDDYIRNLEDRRGRPGRWILGSPLPEEIRILPDKEELVGCTVAEGCEPPATAESPATTGTETTGCTVAGTPGEEDEPAEVKVAALAEGEDAALDAPLPSVPAFADEEPECDRI